MVMQILKRVVNLYYYEYQLRDVLTLVSLKKESVPVNSFWHSPIFDIVNY